MNEHKTLAGALIFAFAARDNEALMAALHGVRDYGNPTAVMLELAATAAGFLQELCGEEWQAALSAALLDVASEGVSDGA